MSNFLKRTKRASEEIAFDLINSEKMKASYESPNLEVTIPTIQQSEQEEWKQRFYEFDTSLITKPFAANTNDRIRWLEENYILIPKQNVR